MKILLLYSIQILPFEQSWYSFYSQVFSYLKDRECISSIDLFVAFLLPADDKEKQIFSAKYENYNFIKLPDCIKFNTRSNKKAILKYIDTNGIECIFNLMHPNVDLCLFLKFIRAKSRCKILNIIHSRPDLVVFNRQEFLSKVSIRQCTSFKDSLRKALFPFYLLMLKYYIKVLYFISYKEHDAIVLLSTYYIPIYQKMISVNMNNIFAIPNPKPLICSKISVEDKKNEIIFVGRLTKEKAVDRLLLIWHKIQNKKKEWSLIIVGDGPEELYLKSIVTKYDLKRVHFVGRVKSVDYIDSAKILCLVSNFEGLPTVFLEAMHLGVIPIGYDTFPAIHDMIDHEKNGYIIPFEDESYYVKALLNIMEDDVLRKQLAENAKLKSESFSIGKIGERWVNVLASLDLLSKK